MVAFNFQPEFALKIQSGAKRMTIRKALRAKVGDAVQLYTGMRTKACQKILDVDPVIIRITPIDIYSYGYNLSVQDAALRQVVRSAELRDNFARDDGFANWAGFIAFFEGRRSLPFSGYVYEWSAPKAAAPDRREAV